MRNIFMLYMPPNNTEAMVHYEDTIQKRVSQERVFRHVSPEVRGDLEKIFGPRPFAVWGSRDSSANRAKFDRMQPGDEVLIVEGPTVKLLGRVAQKTISPQLSRDLWKNIRGETAEGWDLIYFIANPKEVGVPFTYVKELLAYEPDFGLRGFTAVSTERLKSFYANYDDLYSVLLAYKQGRDVERIPARLVPNDQILALDQYGPAPADVDDSAVPQQQSEHLKIQWTLLRMGRQAGERVWAPRGDQRRITDTYKFTDFEPTFAAGLDAQVKYVENIDVVWKAEFRIDAAFEVENSTSIYSGLLRFADLTMVAPNTHYPLFIVAPSERRNRVREQLERPTFRHLRIPEKVRFLSYERVQEIEGFLGPAGQGASVDLLQGKSEVLVK